jgi:Flp pilus assembly CpaF family ATPase
MEPPPAREESVLGAVREAMRILVPRLSAQVAADGDPAEAERLARELVEGLAADDHLSPGIDRETLAKDVAAEVVGWGPLGALLEDNGVREIIVARFDRIFVDREGQLLPEIGRAHV